MRHSLSYLFIYVLVLIPISLSAQQSRDTALLCTFGNKATTNWGDDDYNQVIFIALPSEAKAPFYVRIYDPDCYGALDEANGTWNTVTDFRVYGGAGTYTNPNARSVSPQEGLRSGNLLKGQLFGNEARFDQQWFVLGPFSPTEGEIIGNEILFKLVIEGKEGDDGNLYDLQISQSETVFSPYPNARLFAYEFTFQLPPEENRVMQIQLLPESTVTQLALYNFDSDKLNSLTLRIPQNPPIVLDASGDNTWAVTRVDVSEMEQNFSVNFGKTSFGNNDIVFYAEDQNGRPIPLQYPLPIVHFQQVETEIKREHECNTIFFDASASTDPNGDLLDYIWDFGDGAQAAGVRVSHTYTKSGDYPVMLTVIDNSGAICAIANDVVSININTPPIADAGPNLTGCPNETIRFNGTRSVDPDGAIISYEWDFGDGESGRGATPIHAYRMPGMYTVTLTVTDNSATSCNVSSDQITVNVNSPPVANAGPDQTVGTTTVVFDGTASYDPDNPGGMTGNALIYTWDFGDGSPGKQGPTPFHTYQKPGQYIVTLTVQDRSGTECNISTDTMILTINQSPKANAGTDLVGCAGKPITFDGSRSVDADGSVVEYQWDFGDGNIGEGPKPTHSYERPGTYNATLSVVDNTATLNSRDTDVVTVTINHPPMADAGIDKIVCENSQVVFDGSNSFDLDGHITRYVWDFGDGSKGEGVRPVHVYTKPGKYPVKLTVYDNSNTGCGFSSDEVTITVNQIPVANAGADQTVCSSTVTFDGTKSVDPDGIITQYLWDFGDGAKGSGPRPTHVYPDEGTYLVTLTVKDDSGTNCNSHSDVMTVVINKAPVADAGPDQIVCTGSPVAFNGIGSTDSDGAIQKYMWDFGDGTPQVSGAQATHTYQKSGNYRVILTVTDNSGTSCQNTIDDLIVRVNNPPVAEAGTDKRGCVDEAIPFDGSASYDPDGEIRRYIWDFGDGSPTVESVSPAHVYASPGTYTATLTVYDNSGTTCNSDTDKIVVVINEMPIAEAGEDIHTCNTTVTFDGSRSVDPDGGKLSYHWDFGDGYTGSGPRPTHTYRQPGVYPVTLTVTDDSGTRCNNNFDNLTVFINQPPIADAGEDQVVCLTDIVAFNGSKSVDPDDGVLNYVWDFGDGSPPKSGVVSPIHQYQKGGIYTVTLTVTDDSGVACNTSIDKVTVQVAEAPSADAGPDQTVCANTQVKFDGSKSRDLDGQVNAFYWDFGDGNTGGGMNPTHVYNRAGIYTVTLTITGDEVGNCTNSDTDVMTVTVHEAPTAVAGEDQVGCVGERLVFDASLSKAASPIETYLWDFGDGTQQNGIMVNHAYTKPGTYTVNLTVQDNSGTECNQTSDKLTVIINNPPVANAGEDIKICINDPVKFDGTASVDRDGFITSYEWDFGDGNKGRGVNTIHIYKQPGVYTASLTIRDNSNVACNVANDTRVITVNQPPVAQIGDEQQTVCVGESVQFNGTSSQDADGQITKYEWDFGDGNKGNGENTSHIYKNPGTYQATLRVIDDSGVYCSVGTASTTIIVNQPPIAEAGADKIACPNETLYFDGAQSTDLDGRIVRYEWDFGDGTRGNQIKTSHEYLEPGTYTVTLTVTDDSGTECATATDQLTVIINEPPLAAVTLDDITACVGCAHDEVYFDASPSKDREGGRLSFQWDFGDGTKGVGMRPTHTYTEPGVYNVTLTVIDDSGTKCNYSTINITVNANRAPTPDIQIRSDAGSKP